MLDLIGSPVTNHHLPGVCPLRVFRYSGFFEAGGLPSSLLGVAESLPLLVLEIFESIISIQISFGSFMAKLMRETMNNFDSQMPPVPSSRGCEPSGRFQNP